MPNTKGVYLRNGVDPIPRPARMRGVFCCVLAKTTRAPRKPMGAPFGEGSTRLAKAYHGRAGEVSAGRLYPDAKTKAGGLGRPRRRAREVWILAHESNLKACAGFPT